MFSSRKPVWRQWLQTLLTAALVAAVVIGLGDFSRITSCVAADAPVTADDPFDELRQRIEQLEQDNRELRSAMITQLTDASGQDSLEIPPAPDAAGVDARGVTVDEQRIGSLVESYLRQRPNLTDMSQDQGLGDLRGSVAEILERLNKTSYPSIQVNGVFQADIGFFEQDANSRLAYGHIRNGSDFRRARLSAKGSLSDVTNYFFQMDFAFFGRPTFTDIWVEQTRIPGLGTVRIGQWKQPFSLEVVSSFRFTTFAERSVLFQAFTPFRRLGTGFYNHSENLRSTWAGSVFMSGQDQFGGTLTRVGGIGTSERFTYLPYWDDCNNGRDYLHLGIGHFFNAPPDRRTIFRTIPELYVGANANGVVGTSGQAAHGAFDGTPFFVNTGNLGVSTYNLLGTELLWVRGPLSVQSEVMVNFVNQAANIVGTQNQAGGSMAVLPGMYAQAGYFLTGEHRPYDRKSGQIDRVVPIRNFEPWRGDGMSGWGAWEAAGRFSYLDLNDKNIRGGRIHDYTAGLNWHLNPNWKIQANYIYAVSDYAYAGGDPATNVPAGTFLGNHTSIFDLRCQVDF